MSYLVWMGIVGILGVTLTMVSGSVGCSWERKAIRDAVAARNGNNPLGPASIFIVAFTYMIPWFVAYGILYRSVILCVLLLIHRMVFLYAGASLRHYLTSPTMSDIERTNAVGGLGIVAEGFLFWVLIWLGLEYNWFPH